MKVTSAFTSKASKEADAFPAAQSEEIADTFAEELCEQECEPGFAVDADCDCVDIDECETDPCDQNCENTEGNFICTCDSGYELQEDGITCEELLGCPPCHPNGTCNEDEKVCECRPGFSGDGVNECTDINECDENNGNCSHTCTNTSGGFVCSCDDGYVLNDDGGIVTTSTIAPATLRKRWNLQ